MHNSLKTQNSMAKTSNLGVCDHRRKTDVQRSGQKSSRATSLYTWELPLPQLMQVTMQLLLKLKPMSSRSWLFHSWEGIVYSLSKPKFVLCNLRFLPLVLLFSLAQVFIFPFGPLNEFTFSLVNILSLSRQWLSNLF